MTKTSVFIRESEDPIGFWMHGIGVANALLTAQKRGYACGDAEILFWRRKVHTTLSEPDQRFSVIAGEIQAPGWTMVETSNEDAR